MGDLGTNIGYKLGGAPQEVFGCDILLCVFEEFLPMDTVCNCWKFLLWYVGG